ncbi:PRD domain-containing protein [Clostridiales bacterium COT073_COT-073]|nr:PRD domain-containing protein [Clostridiales bacterium COT073_COT-073]
MSLSHKKYAIISLLLERDEFVNSKFIAFSLGISIRSVKSYIQAINAECEDIGLKILGKRGRGYKIWMADKQSENEIRARYSLKSVALPYNYESSERVDFITKLLLERFKPISVDEILDTLHISIHSFNKDMFSVKMRFNNFRIKVMNKSDAIYIKGSETDIRLCIREYLYGDFELGSKFEHKDVLYDEIHVIKAMIINALNEYNANIAPLVLNNFALHIYLGVHRYRNGNKVILYKYENRWNLVSEDDLAIKLSTCLCSSLNKRYNIDLSSEEMLYYALHFKCKLINSKNEEAETDLAKDCVEDIVKEIENNFGLDFSEDDRLSENLKLHIPPMITRIKAHIVSRNSELTENLRQYLFATKITHSACQIIKRYYGVMPDVNEFGYLVLYFQMALARLIEKNQYRIGVLIHGGRAQQLMYLHDIALKFASQKYKFEILDVNKIFNADYLKDYDMIISTDEVELAKDLNLYLIKRETYLPDIAKCLEMLDFKGFCKEKYFSEANFITDLSVSNKLQAEKKIFAFLLKNGYIKKGFEEFSEFEFTELGKGLVHLQDTKKIISKTICLVVVLSQSIYWSQNPVRIILLTKTKKDSDLDLYAICSMLSRWAKNDYNIIRLLEEKNFKKFFEDLGNT